MNLKYSLIIGLLLPLAFSGCAVVETTNQLPTLEQIDTWVANEEYGRALSAISQIPATEPQYQAYVQRRIDTSARAELYEQRILTETEKDVEQKDWTAALTTLDNSLKNYPSSAVLRQRQKEIITIQQRRIRKLDAKSLIARSQLLYNKLPISEKKVESSIDFTAHWQLQNMRDELNEMHTRLISMSRQMLDDKNLELAEMCLTQAKLLATNDKLRAEIANVQLNIDQVKRAKTEKASRLKKASQKRQKAILNTRHSKRVAMLSHDIENALDGNQLVEAANMLNKLEKMDRRNIDFLRLKLVHREKVDRVVKKKISRGNMLYRQEKIASAKEVWEQALLIDPSNETLLTQIRRATHVLAKLKRLRGEQNFRGSQ